MKGGPSIWLRVMNFERIKSIKSNQSISMMAVSDRFFGGFLVSFEFHSQKTLNSILIHEHMNMCQRVGSGLKTQLRKNLHMMPPPVFFLFSPPVLFCCFYELFILSSLFLSFFIYFLFFYNWWFHDWKNFDVNNFIGLKMWLFG